MTYTLRVDEEDRDLVVDALRAATRQRTTVARKAAGQLAAEKRAGKDVRSAAVKVAGLLAEADALDRYATGLVEAYPDVDEEPEEGITVLPGSIVAPGMAAVLKDLRAKLTGDTPAESVDTPVDVEDDGLSEEAHRLAALAGLRPTSPDAVEDPITGALPEDEPDEPEDVQL